MNHLPSKRCTRCGDVKTSDLFSPHKSKSGLSSWCRACKAEYSKQKRLEPGHREAALAHTQTPAAVARRRELYAQNREKRVAQAIASRTKRRHADKGWLRSMKVWERCKKAGRVPPWVSHTADILPIYRDWYDNYGPEYVVDHIIPIHGKTASGLHVPSNLQIIPKLDNELKQDYFTDEALHIFDAANKLRSAFGI